MTANEFNEVWCEIEGRVRGEAIGRGDAQYESARHVVNGAIDKRPIGIVRPTSTEDVADVVRICSDAGLPIATRCGGHHIAGFGTCDDGIVLDLRHLGEVHMDVQRRAARFGGGTLMSALNDSAIAAGTISNGGTYQSVGTGGLFLGGGVNYLVREYGFASDQLVGAEVVTANGNILQVDEDTNADVLWGLKGAGACLGVVTQMEARVHPLPQSILAGWLLYEHRHAPTVLRFMRDFVVSVPDKLFFDVWFFHVASNSYFPSELHAKPAIGITAVYMGEPAEGEAALRALRRNLPAAADSLRPTTYTDLNVRNYDGGIWSERGLTNYWKSEYLASTLSDDVIEGLTEAAPYMPKHGDFYLLPIRGAMTRSSPADGAYGARTPGWVVHVEAIWRETEEPTEQNIAWIRDVHQQVLMPNGLGYPYLNASTDETPARMRALYGEGRLARLRELKQRLDPENMFRHNPQNLIWRD